MANVYQPNITQYGTTNELTSQSAHNGSVLRIRVFASINPVTVDINRLRQIYINNNNTPITPTFSLYLLKQVFLNLKLIKLL